jgi:hypothetical protein
VPAVRAVRTRRKNRAIDERNARRAEWADAVGGMDSLSPDASPERRGLRASLARKVKAARSLAPSLRRFRQSQDAAFSTAKSLDEQPGKQPPAGESGLVGDGFDDFDRRLGER